MWLAKQYRVHLSNSHNLSEPNQSFPQAIGWTWKSGYSIVSNPVRSKTKTSLTCLNGGVFLRLGPATVCSRSDWPIILLERRTLLLQFVLPRHDQLKNSSSLIKEVSECKILKGRHFSSISYNMCLEKVNSPRPKDINATDKMKDIV